jgi:hypothetical protein
MSVKGAFARGLRPDPVPPKRLSIVHTRVSFAAHLRSEIESRLHELREEAACLETVLATVKDGGA